MAESRLQRWSRQKSEARKAAEPAQPTSVESDPSPEEQELAINETLPEHELLEKYHLPAPDTIELGTDITGFMGKEIPEWLRRKALRALWKSNPVLAVLDGLNDYDEDFSGDSTAGNAVKTLYKVGQGFIDKTANADEQVPVQARKPDDVPETIPAAGRSAEIAEPASPDTPAETPLSPHHSDPMVAEAEGQPAPRYRPRMRFDH